MNNFLISSKNSNGKNHFDMPYPLSFEADSSFSSMIDGEIDEKHEMMRVKGEPIPSPTIAMQWRSDSAASNVNLALISASKSRISSATLASMSGVNESSKTFRMRCFKLLCAEIASRKILRNNRCACVIVEQRRD